MPICHVTMKNNFTVGPTSYKTPTFSPLFCAPLAQGAKMLTNEIWVRPTYACKILSGSVKVCRSYSPKADFEQIHITLSTAWLHTITCIFWKFFFCNRPSWAFCYSPHGKRYHAFFLNMPLQINWRHTRLIRSDGITRAVCSSKFVPVVKTQSCVEEIWRWPSV